MKRDSVLTTAIAKCKVTKLRILHVQYAENLERNINSYGILEPKGPGIVYMDDHKFVTNTTANLSFFNVEKQINVLIVRDHGRGSVKCRRTC